MEFGLMFFSSADHQPGPANYRLIVEATRFADAHGFCAVWTPERHFHEFGGPFPNPALTSAALAMVTTRIQLRAGSLISPLHDPIRMAEEWSVVDNLSGGRVAISFGSGWNANDFVLFPERYARRQAVMAEQIAVVQELWRGGTITRPNGVGAPIEVSIRPRPVQPELPIWVTSSGNIETFRKAGSIGANLLTHLIGQDLAAVRPKIAAYREARRQHGFAAETGVVSLMVHTFIGPDRDRVKATVRAPLLDYLRSAVRLEEQAFKSGGTVSGGHSVAPHDLPADVMDDLLEVTFERYFDSAALLGTPSSCLTMIRDLTAIGVDEVSCLIDFGVDEAAVLSSLEYLDQLRQAANSPVGCAVLGDSAYQST